VTSPSPLTAPRDCNRWRPIAGRTAIGDPLERGAASPRTLSRGTAIEAADTGSASSSATVISSGARGSSVKWRRTRLWAWVCTRPIQPNPATATPRGRRVVC
jgi:hypothetical protein